MARQDEVEAKKMRRGLADEVGARKMPRHNPPIDPRGTPVTCAASLEPYQNLPKNISNRAPKPNSQLNTTYALAEDS